MGVGLLVCEVRVEHVTMSVGTVAVKMDGQERSVQNVCFICFSICQAQSLILRCKRYASLLNLSCKPIDFSTTWESLVNHSLNKM